MDKVERTDSSSIDARHNHAMAAMYILRCSDGSYYVGSTGHLESRLWQHQNGEGAKYTKRRRPVELVYYAETESVEEAYWLEKQVQGWSRAKREALIRGDFDEIRRLGQASRGTRAKPKTDTRGGPRPTPLIEPGDPTPLIEPGDEGA